MTSPAINLRTQRKLQRRDAFLAAARSLFLERGYRGTTVEAIIQRAGGSRETIYKLFGGKHGLFGAIIGDVGAAFAAWIEDSELTGVAPREALTTLGMRLMTLWTSPEGRAVHRLIASEGLESPELLTAWYDGGARLYERALAHYFAGQVAAGALQPHDPAQVARQFRFLLMGELAQPVIAGTPETFDPAAAVERCVDLILRAAAPPP